MPALSLFVLVLLAAGVPKTMGDCVDFAWDVPPHRWRPLPVNAIVNSSLTAMCDGLVCFHIDLNRCTILRGTSLRLPVLTCYSNSIVSVAEMEASTTAASPSKPDDDACWSNCHWLIVGWAIGILMTLAIQLIWAKCIQSRNNAAAANSNNNLR